MFSLSLYPCGKAYDLFFFSFRLRNVSLLEVHFEPEDDVFDYA